MSVSSNTRRLRGAARGTRVALCAAALAAACAALAGQGLPARPAPADAASRATERLRALQAESDALASQGRTLLVELRRLEVARQLRAGELRAIADQAADLEGEIAGTTRQIALLQRTREEQAPAWRARMTELYKLGRGGYARVLLGVQDVRLVGHAYRTVSLLAGRDLELARAHRSTRHALEQARAALLERQAQVELVRQQATEARAAADKAVRDHAALIAALDARRDLNAQLAGELQTARDRLQRTVSALPDDAPVLPLRPFRGALDWPVVGRVLTPFAGGSSSAGGARRSGVEIAGAPGALVAAVHDGVVAYAAPFTGFGNLVIVDHGGGSHSLYGYLEGPEVERGDRVARGNTLGTVGTAPAGVAALYFELRIDGVAVDPLQWLKHRK